MATTTLYRWSGMALLVGALLGLVNSILEAVLYPANGATPQQILSDPWSLVAFMFFAGVLLVSIGLPGLFLRQAARAGGPGLAGFVLLWLGMLLGGVGFASVQATLFPTLAKAAPQLLTSHPPLLVLLLLILGPGLLRAAGAILLGLATLRARILPKGAGILLLVAGISSLLAHVVSSSPVVDFVEPASDVALFLALAWCGYALLARGQESLAASRATSAAQPSH